MNNAKKVKKTSFFTAKQPRSHIKRHDETSQPLSPIQKIILCIIAIVLLLVIVATLFALKYDAKFQVEAKISDLAHDYYEAYYYPNAFGDNNDQATNFLSRYQERGLIPVSVRQMILATDAPDSVQSFLKKYCDINATTVTIFPESPYAHDSYHTKFNYSCNFE